MALAAPFPTEAPKTHGTQLQHSSFRAAGWLLAAFVFLGTLLALLPDGSAEPLQTGMAWLVVAMVATLAVVVIAKVIERLLDCESSQS